MERLPDPMGSRAVLIGTAAYRQLEQLPAVTANLRDLAQALGDPMLWGLPDRHCVVVTDPQDSSALLDPVQSAGEDAEDTLLVYYAGHGLRDADSSDLYLALTGSRANTGYTAVGYQHLRAVVRQSRARRKIIVLDCCFSGRAAKALTGGIIDEAAVDGAYVLAASPRDRVALAPDGEMHTAFTGELLDILRAGIADGPELIDLETIYQELDARLRAKNRPRPQRHQENNTGRLPLVRNRAATAEPLPAGPVLREEVRAAMLGAGLSLARMLRSAGRSRDALPVLRLVLQEGTPEPGAHNFAVQLELAELLADTGQSREAVEVLEQAFLQTRKSFGPEAVLVCRRLADLLQEAGNHIQACEVLKHALDLMEVGSAVAAESPE
ncbi:Caspase domain-containing protein [Actinacidiphila bryophytorum]|uniref:Caspase domain-containing protein n=2 Tax=Actinacidiphila bryophytorum TaxID=1436133 RepID=A0A9W4H3M7_9ACTN|nr:caspase family protein [Actinacidiphila bryophytorum]CAG7648049.1 Caspase domain-containing protein [Actinacidiphila bryophytorum]